ncbi:DegV family protein [Thalassorhabdus alkalitolerans]|uniref:DegV family protein n=1 Tax=Thalassorhabdus alkalitolerans TaxID=2282697 RepID=A0ABW0YQ14_9BACI
MSQIQIVTDSTADIPEHLTKELGITVIPLKVTFDQKETYRDGENLSPEQFYEKLPQYESVPTTSQPTPYEFETVFERLRERNGEETQVFSIHLSSQMSGTYQAATIAAGEVAEKIEVEVVDSKKASYSLGIIVVMLAQYAREGHSFEECKKKLDELLEDTNVYFMVDTLQYLQKNGRIGKASALIGSLLKMKPILSVNEEGQVYPYDKARGKKKAVAKILSAIEEGYKNTPVHIGISHAVAEETAKEIAVQIQEKFDVKSEVITKIGAVIGSHVGPGTVSIAVTKAE